MPQEKIGSIAWLRESQGKLTLGSRLALLRQVLAPSMAGTFQTLLHSGKNEPLRLEEIPLPDSAPVKHALDELHMNGHTTPADGHEAHLLQQGAACDIAGTRYYDFHSSYRESVLQKHPRDHLNKVFADFMANEKAVRPASRSALMYQVGLPLMIKINPYAE